VARPRLSDDQRFGSNGSVAGAPVKDERREPLEQSYRRLASERYRYESGDGQFVADLTVDEMGLVIDYGEIWSREAAG
jgi:uncharacterized protein